MKILVIDDDPAVTELLKLILAPAIAEVITTNSSIQGVQMTADVQPDVVILDLMMPELDGWQVCQKVRAFSNVPILILSAMDSPGMVAAALDAGADDYLIKPAANGVLVAHIHKLLRRNGQAQTNPQNYQLI